MKYIKPNSRLNIRFEDYINQVDIIFDMISLKVLDDEKDKIFVNGFSGIHATKNGTSGKGIGMSRVKQILELNNGDIVLEDGEISTENDSEYNNNIFKISLKKEHYFL